MERLYRQVSAQTIELLVMCNLMPLPGNSAFSILITSEPGLFCRFDAFSLREPDSIRSKTPWTARSLIDRSATQYQDAKSA
jgi:hypothetical protein